LCDCRSPPRRGDYLPLAVSNWWKWRWIEGDEQLGFRTELYREIVAAHENRWAVMQYVFAVKLE
jgi:hypothetical protein